MTDEAREALEIAEIVIEGLESRDQSEDARAIRYLCRLALTALSSPSPSEQDVQNAAFEARCEEGERIATRLFDELKLDANITDGNDSADPADHLVGCIRHELEIRDELLSALKTLTQDSRFNLAIGGNPNVVDALWKRVNEAIGLAERSAPSDPPQEDPR